MERPGWMYVLECADGSLYTGVTTDPQRRWMQHRRGKGARYTRVHPPVALRGLWRYSTWRSALRAEAAFKRLSHAAKVAHLAASAPWRDGIWDAWRPDEEST